jgi:hypothetical protein
MSPLARHLRLGGPSRPRCSGGWKATVVLPLHQLHPLSLLLSPRLLSPRLLSLMPPSLRAARDNLDGRVSRASTARSKTAMSRAKP